MSALSDLVSSERARLGLSVRAVADRSGGLVTSSTVHGIERDQRASVTDQTLRGLAAGLNLPVTKLRKAAGLAVEDLGRFELPAKADRLGRKERAAVLAVVDALLDARRR